MNKDEEEKGIFEESRFKKPDLKESFSGKGYFKALDKFLRV